MGFEILPIGTILLWTKTLAEIPPGWTLCNGASGTPNLLDKYVKGVPSAVTEPGSTGGAATHGHVSSTHTHNATHSHSQSGTPSATATSGSGSVEAPTNVHRHSGYDSTNPTTGAGTQNVLAAASDPAYFTVAYIMRLR